MNLLVRLFIKNYKNVEDSKVRESYGVLTGIVGIILNVLLFAGKLAVGLISNSVSVTADAFNNISDAGSSVISMVGFKLSNKPVDKKHPFGHGRMEYLSGLIVSMIIIFVGFELIVSSVEKIFTPEEIDVSVVALVVLGVSVLVKLWMFAYNFVLSKRISSAGMRATAFDSISDAVATTVVLAGSLVFKYTGVNIDAYAGVVVALFVTFTGLKSAKETVDLLVGSAPSPEFIREITDFVLSYDMVYGVHDLIVHNYGVGRELVSLHVEVPCNIDIMHIHEQIDEIENALTEKFHVHAVIHMDPIEVDDQTVNEIRDEVKGVISELYPTLSMHDFRVVNGKKNVNCVFDIVVPYEYKDEEKVAEDIKEKVKEKNARLNCVISTDRPLC
ncbi:MAG: cation diffusion facilitator family transporter [Christensenellaceae bacterium]|nr:cation diffusion facilitator family transporter [Christensenellaceae bacterium]MDD6926330.1 cation diffusion facilitator family transporter [bacterium]MDY2850736.1 cation diffusion facilitator family transporter [Christensenellaceae bacterium]